MSKYIDAHCHITDAPLPAGGVVSHWVCNATNESDWTGLLARATDTRIVPCIGIHPWLVDTATDGWDARMRATLQTAPNVMIGECGLDKLHGNWDAQVDVFQRHLDLARAMHRTLHIHCVRAWGPLLDMLHAAAHPRVVLHAFHGSPEIIRALTNAYFSFSDMILQHPAPRLRACIAAAPLDKILVETDGAPDAAADILPQIIDAIAQIKSVPTDEMTEIIYNNTKRMIENG